MEGFALKEFDALQRIKAPMIDIADIEKNHHPTYVAEIFDKMPTEGRVYLDPDTAMSPSSGEASRRSAGAFCDAIDKVLSGEADNAFCAVRPPGQCHR